MVELTYFQAIVIGLLQGVTELFPISSLGHAILVPALLGGSWSHFVTEYSATQSESSPFLSFVVALHVGSAIALIVFYWQTWVRIVKGFFMSLKKRAATTPDEHLAWLLIIATIPVGITGLLLEHPLRVLFAKPLAAALFLIVNGIILYTGERLRSRAETQKAKGDALRKVNDLTYKEAGLVGIFQILALLAGISRSGVTMVAGLTRQLSHEDAANFAFLLATPAILAAGILKLPDLFGPAGAGIGGQAFVGAVVAGAASYVSVRFLTRYFQTKTLTPFAIYCVVFGVLCLIRFGLF